MDKIVLIISVLALIFSVILKILDFFMLNYSERFLRNSLNEIFLTNRIKKQLYEEYPSSIHKIDIDYKKNNRIHYKIYLYGDWQNNKSSKKFFDDYQFIKVNSPSTESKYKFINNKFQETLSIKCRLLQEELLAINSKEKLLKEYILLSKNVDKLIYLPKKSSDSTYSHLKRQFITRILNAGLIDSVRQKTARSVSKNEVEETTIIGMMMGKKIKKDTRAYLLLFAGLVTYLLFGLFTSQINLFGLMLIILAILALQLNQKVTEYRIKKGFFGTNYYEAREIIQFIVENADENFYSGGKIKEILPEAIVFEEEAICVEGGVFA